MKYNTDTQPRKTENNEKVFLYGLLRMRFTG
jgi:hypothetical protein